MSGKSGVYNGLRAILAFGIVLSPAQPLAGAPPAPSAPTSAVADSPAWTAPDNLQELSTSNFSRDAATTDVSVYLPVEIVTSSGSTVPKVFSSAGPTPLASVAIDDDLALAEELDSDQLHPAFKHDAVSVASAALSRNGTQSLSESSDAARLWGGDRSLHLSSELFAPMLNRLHGSRLAVNVGGVITQPTTWIAANSPYTLTADVTVASGVTLTIEPGVIVKFFQGTSLSVNGALVAQGTTSDPVYFTSIKDDTVGGDTNGDGDASSPAPGDWRRIHLNSAVAKLSHVVLRYGGSSGISDAAILSGIHDSVITMTDSVVEYSATDGVHAQSSYGCANGHIAHISLTNVTVRNSQGTGISTYTCSNSMHTLNISGSTLSGNGNSGIWAAGLITAAITNTAFISNTGYAGYLNFVDGVLTGSSGNTGSGNAPKGGLALVGSLRADAALGSSASLPYVLSGLTMNPGTTLTLQAGVIVKGENSSSALEVYGALVAQGTTSDPVYFTSIKDDTVGGDTNGDGDASSPAPGDWRRIQLYSAVAKLSHVVLRYGGSGGISDAAILSGIHDSVITMTDSVVEYSATDGVHVQAGYGCTSGKTASISLSNVIVRNNVGTGVSENGCDISSHTLNIINSTIISNGNGGILAMQLTGSPLIARSSIAGNAGYGINNTNSSTILSAEINWWGHPSGPYHPITNPDGLGNSVSDNVVFDPWLVMPAGSRLPIELMLGQPLTGSINLNEYKDYYFVTTAGQSLVVEVTPLSGSESLWVFSRLGDLPLWTRYDLRTQEKTARGAYELLVSPTQDGTYYFSIYGRSVFTGGGNFRIAVNAVDRYLSDIAPRSAGNAGAATLTLSGLGFVEGMTVQLRRAGSPTLSADSVTLASPTGLWAHFNLSGAATGVYDVYAIWPTSQQASLTGAFTVTPGLGPRLETRLVAPESVRPGREYVLRVEYSNVGDADMPAPLLRISAKNADLKLPEESSFTSSVVQVFATNTEGPTGILPPGFGGILALVFKPSSSGGTVDFSVWHIPEDDWSVSSGSLLAAKNEPAGIAIPPAGDEPSLPTADSANESTVSIIQYDHVPDQVFFSQIMADVTKIQSFLEQRQSPLADYHSMHSGTELSAAEIIAMASVHEDWHINPEILLAYMHWRWGLLDAADVSSSDIDRLVAISPEAEPGLLGQLSWLAENLWATYSSNSGMQFAAERSLKSVMAEITDEHEPLVGLNDSFVRLFGRDLNTPAALTETDWRPIFRKPLDGYYPINSFMDHGTQDDGRTTRPDGRSLNGTLASCTLGYSCYDKHAGIDYSTGISEVRAVSAGTILQAGLSHDNCGTYYADALRVIISHTNELQSKYWHLDSIANNPATGKQWAPGDAILEGGLVGNSGTTGCSSGNHLHFAVNETTGAIVDPYGWWGANSDARPGVTTHRHPLFRSDTTINEDGDGFERFYNSGWNPSTGDGGHSFYVDSRNNQDYLRWALWWADISTAGNYAVLAYIPPEATTNGTSVNYMVMHQNGIERTVARNQQEFGNRWLSLGTYSFEAHGQSAVLLSDYSTGPSGRRIYFDTVRWVRPDEIGCGEDPACDPTDPPSASGSSTIVRPIDPNDKAGPAGFGESRIVSTDSTLLYTIDFENVMTATAPVQELVVVDYLDPNLDWTTLRFNDIAYGSDVIVMPDGIIEYAGRDFPSPASITGTTEGPMAIDVTTAFDPLTGRVEWRLRAIDTATGLPPADPLAGFLPPEDGTGRGQGHVSFFIKPKPSTPHGTRIANTASITFDTNDPIATNEVWNTIGIPGYRVFLPAVLKNR